MAPDPPVDSPTPASRATAPRKPRVAASAKAKPASRPAAVKSRAAAVTKTAAATTPSHEARASKPSGTAKSARRGGKGTGAMLGAAAAGLAAGLAANFGRKAVAQASSALAGDWFEALKGEHRAALALFDALEATKESATRARAMLLMQLKHALIKHARTEENVLYPVLREAGDKGTADKFNHEHGLLKDYLYQLGVLPKGAPAFLVTLGEFRSELGAHIREEEESVFPALHAKLGAQKNKAVTQAANKEGFLAA